MANKITVNTSTLKTKASTLKSLNSRFKNQISNLTSQESSLNSMWDGDANTAFHTAFQKDITQMNNFYNAIEKYVSSLTEIAAKYDSAEQANQNIATTRNY
jgi:WXG100 family type VII secretion target